MNRIYRVFYNFIGAIIGLSIGMYFSGSFGLYSWGLKLAVCLLLGLLVELLITPLLVRINSQNK